MGSSRLTLVQPSPSRWSRPVYANRHLNRCIGITFTFPRCHRFITISCSGCRELAKLELHMVDSGLHSKLIVEGI